MLSAAVKSDEDGIFNGALLPTRMQAKMQAFRADSKRI